MGKIRILYIIDCLDIGGTENQLAQTITRLDKNRFEPFLCCLRSTERTSLCTDYVTKIDLNCNKLILDVYSLKSIKCLLKIYSLVRYLIKNRIDIVQTYFVDSNIVGTIAGKLAGVRAIISSRREMVYWYTPQILFIFKLLNTFTTRILANSKSVKEHISRTEKIKKNKIDLIYNGIDLSSYKIENRNYQEKIKEKIGIDLSAQVVGIVSNVNRRVKRVDVFIKAASEVLKVVPETSLIIIGEGKLKAELIQLAKELDIYQKIRFLGLKKNIIPYLFTFDVAVNSSDSEGFSNAVLEYMAAGLPVVATSFGGSSEIVEHRKTGILVPPNDHKKMARAIIKLLHNEKLRHDMGIRARDVVQNNYCFNKVIKKLEDYYISLLNVST